MKCKKCNYNFHYCTNCDYDNYNSKGYCSEQSWKESDEFKLVMKLFLELVGLIPTNKGLYLLDAVIANSDDYYFYFQQEILERLKKG